MFERICGSLDRQSRALFLLSHLLEEEFSYLARQDTIAVMEVEFSLHELLRQIAREKEEVINQLGGGRVLDYAAMLQEEEANLIQSLYYAIDDAEQECARKATQNTELALGLMDQSTDLLNFIHKRLIPQNTDTYTKKGAYNPTPRPDAALISGSL